MHMLGCVEIGESAEYLALAFSTYSFEAGSLSESGSFLCSARQEADKSQRFSCLCSRHIWGYGSTQDCWCCASMATKVL